MSGFFTGFATGFANRATDISQDRETQRNRNLEQAMQRLAATAERRREELAKRQQQRAAARLVASSGFGISESNAEGLLAAGVPMSDIMSGRYQMDAPQAAPTPPSGGLMQPPGGALPGTPATPPGAPTDATVGMPSAATSTPPAAIPDPRDAVSTPSVDSPGIVNQIGSAMFGRDPFHGVEQEVRQRYMRESGMTQQQMDELMAPPAEAPAIQGNIRYNQFTPAEQIQMRSLFLDDAGFNRARDSGWRDLSGVATQTDKARLQAMVAAAGRSRSGERNPYQLTMPQVVNQATAIAARITGARTTHDATGNILLSSEMGANERQAARLATMTQQVMMTEFGNDARMLPQAARRAIQLLNADRADLPEITLPAGWNAVFSNAQMPPPPAAGEGNPGAPLPPARTDPLGSEGRTAADTLRRMLQTNLTPPPGQAFSPNQVAMRQAAVLRDMTAYWGTLSPQTRQILEQNGYGIPTPEQLQETIQRLQRQ